ncbi:hypothetical protein GCM10027446_02800 [Angustibacter peucedani]
MSKLSAARARLAAWSAVQWAVAVLLVAVVASGGLVVRNVVARAAEPPGGKVPQSAAMEAALGIRVSRVAVVGDGGLVEVSYVALDPEKATKFQYDKDHPPRLSSEVRDGGTSRISVMRQGHNMRAGQTYYFVYQNTGGAIRPDERITFSYGGYRLEHVPVL